MSLPTAQLTLEYETFFGEPTPVERIKLLDGMPKRELLAEISGLNYRLKPKDSIEYDNSYETQVRELKRFACHKDLRLKYLKIFNEFYDKKNNMTAIIFSRQSCLFALEEISKSDLLDVDEKFEMSKIEVWDNIIKYILCVNECISRINESPGEITFEQLNAKLLPLNELSVAIDPLFLPYRGYSLLKYFAKHPILGPELENYIKSFYSVGYEKFVYDVISMYMANKQGDPDFNFWYSVRASDDNTLFEEFSKKYDDAETIKLVRSRKYPFVKINEETYLLIDNVFLLEKIFSQFIHDFWFDWLKGIKNDGVQKYKIDFYKSVYGYFTESYVKKWIDYMFKARPNYVVLTFDELKLKVQGAEIELADIYIRNANKILLGQVKSGSVYDNEKFGGDVELLYKGSREKFFKNFGVNQIVESIRLLDANSKRLDSGFPRGRKYEIFPCIIVSDKVFQTPVMADVFNTRFQELIAEIDTSKIIVHALSLLHINDLERMSSRVNGRPKYIWKFLNFNVRNRGFIPPFYNTLNINLVGWRYPQEVRNTYYSLIEKYSNRGS